MERRANIREALEGSYGSRIQSKEGEREEETLKKSMEADRLLSKEMRRVVFSN